ncbi:MAG: hypothetical protein NT062_19435 [Proteobacteria bacterium]|nr:hypothetical protein [Pseudomonadota bacterium]
MRAWLGRHGWLVAIACAYLYLFPYFPKITSANELPRVYLVKAMVDDHTFAIDRGVSRWGSTADVSPHGDHKYSNKSPGSSLLAAPAYAVARLAGLPADDLATSMWICRVATGVIPTLLFLVLLYGFLERFAPDPWIRKLVVVGYALGSMAMTYSLLYYSHQLGAVCIASAWMLLVDVVEPAGRARGWRAVAAAGFLVGAAPLVDYQAVFAAVPVAIYVVVTLRRDLPRLARYTGIALGFAGIPIAVLLTYHAICFGSPWKTGYDASTTFAMYHQQGFLGITKLRWDAFAGSMISADNGLVTLAPWFLLAIPGAYWLMRRARSLAITCLAIVAIYLLFISSINFWRGGWEVGPRYVTAMLPFLLPAIAAQLQACRERPWLLGVLAGTVLVGIAIYTLSSATFPYWPDSIQHPLYDVTFRLLADDRVAPNLGRALGVGGVLGIVPYLAIVAGLAGYVVYRVATWRGLVVAIVVATVVLVAYRGFARGNPERPYQFVHDAVGA